MKHQRRRNEVVYSLRGLFSILHSLEFWEGYGCTFQDYIKHMESINEIVRQHLK